MRLKGWVKVHKRDTEVVRYGNIKKCSCYMAC